MRRVQEGGEFVCHVSLHAEESWMSRVLLLQAIYKKKKKVLRESSEQDGFGGPLAIGSVDGSQELNFSGLDAADLSWSAKVDRLSWPVPPEPWRSHSQ